MCIWFINNLFRRLMQKLQLSYRLMQKLQLSYRQNESLNPNLHRLLFNSLRIQWRLIFAIILVYSRLQLWVGYFIYFKFTPVFSWWMFFNSVKEMNRLKNEINRLLLSKRMWMLLMDVPWFSYRNKYVKKTNK